MTIALKREYINEIAYKKVNSPFLSVKKISVFRAVLQKNDRQLSVKHGQSAIGNFRGVTP